jgi:hypothetical protein
VHVPQERAAILQGLHQFRFDADGLRVVRNGLAAVAFALERLAAQVKGDRECGVGLDRPRVTVDRAVKIASAVVAAARSKWGTARLRRRLARMARGIDPTMINSTPQSRWPITRSISESS